MLTQAETDCLRAVNQCAAACLQCVVGCLDEIEVRAMTRCITLNLECADLCRLAATSIARNSEHLRAILLLCATACDSCFNECSKHDMTHCQHGAKACKHGAEACRALAH